MSYFGSVKSFDELKAHYRALAMQHHPDRGGDLATMQAINAEYDALYIRWNSRKASDQGYESAQQYRAAFYREQGWTGERYSHDLSKADLAVIFRAYVKKHWPQCKFSVTRRHYNDFTIALMQAPFSPWLDLSDEANQREIERRKQDNPYYDPNFDIDRGYRQVNHYHIESDLLLSAAAKALFKDICAFVQSYNFDYSDSQTDYFHTNFYLNLAVGKWNKPFVQKGNMPISDSTEIKEAA